METEMKGGVLLAPAVGRITQRILDGEYGVGDRLPTETQLQEDLGVSRSVVREAMKILSSRGLVRIEQGRGTFVSTSDTGPMKEQFSLILRRAASPGAKGGANDDFDHLIDVRRVLEVAVAERAAQFAQRADIDEMEDAIAAMRAHPDEAGACAAADSRFHLVLARSSRNPLWPAILGSLNDLLIRLQEMGHLGTENALMTADEHQAILSAIRARDSAAAVSAMKQHLQTSAKDLSAARRDEQSA